MAAENLQRRCDAKISYTPTTDTTRVDATGAHPVTVTAVFDCTKSCNFRTSDSFSSAGAQGTPEVIDPRTAAIAFIEATRQQREPKCTPSRRPGRPS